MPDNQLWTEALKECETVEAYNALAVSVARDRRSTDPQDGFAKLVVTEAKRRGYRWVGDRSTGCYIEKEKP